ncbi:hypothetical protein N8364_03380 [Saprospiraceae bacterium]|nr:hypothetical protein [Saprospiraceae bacterium]
MIMAAGFFIINNLFSKRDGRYTNGNANGTYQKGGTLSGKYLAFKSF